MLQKPMLRLVIGMGLPIASALVLEQLPKTGVAEVPFAFQVEEQTLPRGTYAVKQADYGRAVSIQNEKVAGVGMNCAAVKGKFGRAQGARLVFENYAGRYFLREIWFDADGRGLILPESRLEQNAASDASSSAERREVRCVRFE
jgi:hypothetical protein